MSEPAVSIYIYTYLNSEQRGKVLIKTCEWALRQRYPTFEVVVSDNGSPYSVFDALASIEDPRLRIYINQENVGAVGNLNRCLEQCSYDIIKPLCDDDLIHPDFLTAAIPLLDESSLVVVDVEKFVYGEEPEELSKQLESPIPWETRNPGYGHDIWNLPYSASCIPSATLFTRKLFRELGGYDSNTILYDWDFFIEACLYAKVVHMQQTLCFVAVWGGSLTEEMKEDPYFFGRECLYTIFRVFRCKALPVSKRVRILLKVLKDIIWEGLRPIKHLLSKTYRTGYFAYVRYLFKLMFMESGKFGPRPNNP